MRYVGTVSSLFLGLILCCTVSTYAEDGKTYKPQSVEVYFSPKGGATEAVVTGSFNFTKSAEENNAENLLVINDPELAARYIQNWQEYNAHSEPYEGR